jgi:hypothetical protein
MNHAPHPKPSMLKEDIPSRIQNRMSDTGYFHEKAYVYLGIQI